MSGPKDYTGLIESQIPFDQRTQISNVVENYPFTYVPVEKHEYNPTDDQIAFLHKLYAIPEIKRVFEKKRLSKEEIALLKQRLRESESIDFEEFALRVLDPKNPYTLEILDKEYPEIISSRNRAVDRYVNFLKRLVKIAIRGMHTKEDIALMYNIQKGALEIPPGILGTIFSIAEQNQRNVQEGVDEKGRGIFNARKARRLEKRLKIDIPNSPFPLFIDESGAHIGEKEPKQQMGEVSFLGRFRKGLENLLIPQGQ